jgi:hypothetical protein
MVIYKIAASRYRMQTVAGQKSRAKEQATNAQGLKAGGPFGGVI